MMPTKTTGIKRITLNWEPFYTPQKVCLVAVFAPSVEGGVVQLNLDCARHQADVESFSGQVGETLVSTQTCYYKATGPSTVVHFGLGRLEHFSLPVWQAALTAAFKRTRNYNVLSLAMDLDAIGLQSFLDSNSYDFGKVTSLAARAVLGDATCVEFVDVGIRYQTPETRLLLQQGFDDGFD